MKALMLAAGLGRRLYGDDNEESPKALLAFGGKTLMQRHIEVLLEADVEELVVVVGHHRDELVAEASAWAPEGFVRTVFNPRYRESPMLSLWTAREVLRAGDDILFMDADVLYHPSLLHRLVRSPHADCFIIDRDFEAGDEPVKLCLRDGLTVDFGKQITEPHDTVGEWPGFLRMSPRVAGLVADRTEVHVAGDPIPSTYEEAMLDVLRAEPAGTFGVEDVTGIPWIEIDFPADAMRAARTVIAEIERFWDDDQAHAAGEV